MKITQGIRTTKGKWKFKDRQPLVKPLVLVFGDRFILESKGVYEEVRDLFPDGELVFGSTSGEILESQAYEGTLTLTAIEFQKTKFQICRENISDFLDIGKMGKAIASKFNKENLGHVFIVSDGSFVNGSGLVEGLMSEKGFDVPITGGLCGDGTRFEKTLVSYNETPKQGEVVAIGFYGDSLEVSYSNYGGWTPFGPERTVTKSQGNVLYEIDGRPALDLYKKYLGEKAEQLPQAALYFPLAVQSSTIGEPLARTILNIDEATNSMVLAGDVPQHSKVQLMMCTMDDITFGAFNAAELAMRDRVNSPELAILVSCVGRKLIMAERKEEEIDEILEVVGNNTKITGFYSYGEMAPFAGTSECQLHNQTMTVTLMSE